MAYVAPWNPPTPNFPGMPGYNPALPTGSSLPGTGTGVGRLPAAPAGPPRAGQPSAGPAIPMPTVSAPGVLTSPLTSAGQLPNALETASTINAANLDYTRRGQQTDPTYAMIQNLLNPNWGPAVYDTGEASAENALGLGISGSNLANFRGARMYEGDLINRAGVANTLLTGATGRLPTPYDINNQLITPLQQSQLSLSEQQLLQQGQLAREAQAQETARAIIAANARYNRPYAGGGGGGGVGGGAGRGTSVKAVSGGAGPGYQQPAFDYSVGGPRIFYGTSSTSPAVPGSTGSLYGPTYPDYSFGTPGGQNMDFANFSDNIDFTDFGNTGDSGDWWNQPLTNDEYFDLNWYGY